MGQNKRGINEESNEGSPFSSILPCCSSDGPRLMLSFALLLYYSIELIGTSWIKPLPSPTVLPAERKGEIDNRVKLEGSPPLDLVGRAG